MMESTKTLTRTTAETGGAAAAVGVAGVRRTARTTGLLYLAFFVIGIAGNLVVRARLFAPGDPHGTLTNLVDHPTLARLGIGLELGIVLTQALTALWFYRLFRGVDTFAAGALAAFGMVSATAILGSAGLLASALHVAQDNALAARGDAAATVQLLYVTSGDLWGVAAVFFGLWLIPMGWLAVRSGWLPRVLGWLLVVGGVGYLASAFVAYLFASGDAVAQVLTIPATLGEVWIMVYLVAFGIREHPHTR